MNYRVQTWGSMTLAVACWLLATGFAVEKVLRDGVQSWTLLAAMPVLTLAAGVLLHQAFENVSGRPVRSLVSFSLAILVLAVTLPASIGSSGSARDAAVAEAEASNRSLTVIKDDLANVSATLKWAEKDMIEECASGEGPRCLGKRSTVQALTDRKAVLTAQLQTAPAEKNGLSGETRIAWALGLVGIPATEAQVQMAWPMLPPIAFEFLFAFFWSAASRKRETATISDSAQTSFPGLDLPAPEMFSAPAPVPPAPKKKTKRQTKKDRTIQALREYTLKNGAPPSFKLVQARYRLPKATASRWRSEAMKDVA